MFENLSDYDFEQLTADLLSAEWQTRVDSFPRGRDGGVDLRVLGPTGGPLALLAGQELIVQCKHRPGSNYSALRGELRSEAQKAVVSDADRYVLVTSARLTRLNKRETVDIYGGRVAEADIFAREDLVAMLRRHPEIEKANLKLWLTSAGVAQAVFHQAEHLRSAALAADLERIRFTFVETAVLRDAREKLEQYGICLLVGPPGIGKTTTASILLLQYMAAGWQPIRAVAAVHELEVQLQPGLKQVLFFDDFLGSNAVETKLGRGEDAELLRLMRVVEADRDKALILTTREYVLQQQRQQYEKLSDPLFDVAKVAIRLAEIPPSQRAHILYNQLYYSPLRDVARHAADGPRRYSNLVQHSNFNPRLLQAAIAAAARDLGVTRRSATFTVDSRPDGQVPGQLDVLDLPERLRQALDNPAELWDHVLRHQLTDLQRDLLIVRLTLAGRDAGVETLFEATERFAATANQPRPRPMLDDALQVLIGDLIPSYPGLRDARLPIAVRSLDPGLADAIIDYLVRYPEILRRLSDAAITYRQVRWLATLAGVVPGHNDRASTRAATSDLTSRLLAAAERTLLSSQAIVPPVDPARDFARFENFGERLETLAAICTASGTGPSSALADRVFPPLIRAIPAISEHALPRLVASLRLPGLESWRSRRTEVDVAVLRRFEAPGRDAPETFETWEILRDVLDVVPTMPAYLQHLRDLFADFLSGSLDEIEAMIDAAEEEDFDVSIADVERMSTAADRWDVTEPRLDEALNAVIAHEVIDRQPSRFIPGPAPARPAPQSTGWHGTQSIFDRL
jgi:hypothetical protein